MNALGSYPGRSHSRAYAEGWTASVLLHVFGLLGAVLLASKIQLAPQPTPFTWEIAMIEPSPSKPETVQQSTPVKEPEPVKQPEPKVTEPQPAVRQVQTRTIQPVQKPVRQQVREVRQAVQPVVRPVDQAMPTVQTTQATESIQTTKVTPVVSQTVEAQTYSVSSSPTPVQAQSEISSTTPKVIEQTVAQSQPASVASKEAIQSKPGVTQVASAPQVREQAIVEHHPADPIEQSEIKTQTTPVTTQRTIRTRTESTAGTETSPITRQIVEAIDNSIKETSKAVTQDVVTQNLGTTSETVRVQEQTVTSNPQSFQSREDYSWLADLLWKRIEQFKRYPAKARMRHWEGQVVLLAVITNAGEVTTVDVVKSSGYDVLDDNAIEALRLASPITLNQALEKSQVAIQIPIHYRLGR